MNIKRIESWIVRVPMERPLRWSLGVHTGTTRTIIQIDTDDGLIGIGEAPGAVAKAVIDQYLKPALLDQSPLNIQKVITRCQAFSPVTGLNASMNMPVAAVETACWDILGKLTEQPIHALLGGAVRDRVEHNCYIFPWRTSSELATDAEVALSSLPKYCGEVMTKHGFKSLELKVGVFPPQIEVDLVAAIRKAVGPTARIRLDSNQVWTLDTAITTLNAMSGEVLSNVEEPVPGLESMAKLKALVGLHFSTHSPDVQHVAAIGAADAIVGDLHDAGALGGGIIATKKLIASAEASGLDFWLHSSNELGISATVGAHLAASSVTMVHANQGMHMHLVDDIVKDWKSHFGYLQGSIPVPTQPGLGVELDMQKVDRYSKLYGELVSKGTPADTYFCDVADLDWVARRW